VRQGDPTKQEIAQMLYQPQPKFKFSQYFARFVSFLAARRAEGAAGRADRAYLDRVPPRALEELGLRRGGDGSYKPY